jgi:two-component sensor histidine kinase
MILDSFLPQLQLYPSGSLREQDQQQICRINAALPITADVSRADILLYGRLSAQRLMVLRHVMPNSISSHYPAPISGRNVAASEQPLVQHAFMHGRGGRRQLEIVSSGAPVIQDVFPVFNAEGQVIAAFVVETNMIAHERQRRRDPTFRRAVLWLQAMCMRGEIMGTDTLGGFGLYDGIYIADRNRLVTYMSGITANLFRSIGLAVDMGGQQVAELEPQDDALVDEVLSTNICIEQRHETADGRVWIRKGLPLHRSPTWRTLWLRAPRLALFRPGERSSVDAVMVLIHNATDAVAKERELNVKSAIIQEVHHRVKNNLQTIAAILRIQARRVVGDEARQQLSDAVNRILSVALIHEFLSEDEHQPINIRDLCQRIAHQVQKVADNPEQEIAVDIVGPNIRLPSSQATPVAIVLNELVLNALEHGLAGYSKGRIVIDLSEEGNMVQLVIRNSGSSLPPDFDPRQSQSLGLQIVQTLVQDDLKGELKITSIAPPQAAQEQEKAQEDGEEAERDEMHKDGQITHGTQAIVTFPKRSLKVD